VSRKLQKSHILFAYPVQDSNSTLSLTAETNDLATGSSQFALNRLDLLHRSTEVLLEKIFENVHRICGDPPRLGRCTPKITPSFATG
jgi:hypothetical protein